MKQSCQSIYDKAYELGKKEYVNRIVKPKIERFYFMCLPLLFPTWVLSIYSFVGYFKTEDKLLLKTLLVSSSIDALLAIIAIIYNIYLRHTVSKKADLEIAKEYRESLAAISRTVMKIKEVEL